MIMPHHLLLFIIVYIFFCGFTLYLCFFADAETSDMAYLIQIAIPTKAWNLINKVVGDKNMGFIDALKDRFLIFVYLFVVLGCWTVVFWYVYPSITESSSVSNVHKYIGCVVFVACFGSWRLTNTASPGFVTAKTFKQYDHYPYDHLLFLPNRRCQSTNLIRIPRSKFDRIKYNRIVPRYDHFCGWVYNTIGGENYRWFLLFLLIHAVMCGYGSTVCMLLFWGEIKEKRLLEITFFDRSTGDSVQSNWFIVSQYLFAQRTAECSAMMVMFVMAIALGLFLGYHLHLTSINQTTNENGKWSAVNRWYKAEKKKYDDAVKKGLIKPDELKVLSPQTQETLVDDDGDVTCTGGSSSARSEAQQEQENDYVDPGPAPKNVHDRGFIENWKEVLFPISLRKNALALGGYSRPSQHSKSKPKASETPPPTRKKKAT